MSHNHLTNHCLINHIIIARVKKVSSCIYTNKKKEKFFTHMSKNIMDAELDKSLQHSGENRFPLFPPSKPLSGGTKLL